MSEEEDIFYDSSSEYESESESNSKSDTDIESVDYTTIKLLKHQKDVIKYLVGKCRNQKGMLVNHYQGTGKTTTGLYFVKNYPKYKKVIIAPDSLKSMWQQAFKNNELNIKNLYFLSFDQINELFQENDDEIYKRQLIKIRLILQDSILLVDEAHNLINIIENNYEIATEESLQDINEIGIQIKERKRRKQNNKEIIFYKQKVKDFFDLFKICKRNMLLTGTPVTNDLSDIRWLINIASGKNTVPLNKNDFNEKYLYINKIDYSLNEILVPLLNILGFNSYIDFTSIKYFKGELNNLMFKLSSNGITGNILIDSTMRSFLVQSIITTVDNYYSKYNFQEFNIKNIDWGKYISFYKYENSEFYPTFKVISKDVLYTNYQLDLWNRCVLNKKITNKESVELGSSIDIYDAELFKPFIDMKQCGLIIGNLGKYPQKFKNILDDYISNPINTLIYSSYYESGILLLSNYLESENIKHKIYEPSLSLDTKEQILLDFQNKKITLLLLHPKYYEGFSIKGVRKFHILEPIKQYNIKEQLYTRVIRYKSHYHLPKNEQNVDIIQWYCTLNNIKDKLRQSTELLKKLNLQDIDKILNLYGSPDDMILSTSDNTEFKLNALATTLKDISIDNKEYDKDQLCCIFGDNECSSLPKCENY